MARKRNYVERVYVSYDEHTGDYVVRIATPTSDFCLCVCNGEYEADIIAAMVKACAWNTSSPMLIAKAIAAFTKFIEG